MSCLKPEFILASNDWGDKIKVEEDKLLSQTVASTFGVYPSSRQFKQIQSVMKNKAHYQILKSYADEEQPERKKTRLGFYEKIFQ